MRRPRRSIVTRRTALQAGAALIAGSAVGIRPSYAAPPPIEPRLEFLENEFVRLGVDLAIGGSIVHLSGAESKTNLVNSHDWGRQVQMSHYAAPVPFEPRGKRPMPHWKGLGWNPVQSGDAYGYPSEVLDFRRERDSLRVTCRPMHWPLENEPAECVFESRLKLDGPVVRAECRIACDRSDDFVPQPRDQELPAVYTNGRFHRLVTYSGEKPFAGDKLVEVPKRGPAEGWGRFWATERWAALVDDDGFGLGVLSPETTRFLGGFSGRPGTGGDRDAPCGYVAPVRQETLGARIEQSYRYALVVGSAEEIRAAALREFVAAKLPAWKFGPGRDGWNAIELAESGYPFDDGWSVVPKGDDPRLVGPPTFWRAVRAPRLRIEAACEGLRSTGAGSEATIFIQPLGDSSPIRTSFPLDGAAAARRHYEVDLKSAEGYSGAMTSLRIDPPEGCRRFRLYRVELVGE